MFRDHRGLQRGGGKPAVLDNSVGYAVFPTIGKGGVGIGGAYGKGGVYKHGKDLGDTSMTQVTVGFQFGGQAYSQINFFEDDRALKSSPVATSNSVRRHQQWLLLPG